MHPLSRRVRQTIEKHQLVSRGGRILVALSGGPDSVALLYLLRELSQAGELTLAGIAHFNHRLRGDAADADERFCRDLAADLGIAIEVGAADVRSLAFERKVSLEEAARDARYAWLSTIAAALDVDAVAVGHSRDDQAETFLLKLLRGAGPRGLGGIYPRKGLVIRPLLDIPRTDLLDYLKEHSREFREDQTNLDLSNPRNRIRHELIPYLKQFSPVVVDVLAREAAIAREDGRWLDELAAGKAPGIVSCSSGSIEIDVTALLEEPPALGWRIAMQALAGASGGRFVGFAHVDALLGLARHASPGMSLDLPGQTATRLADRIVLTRRSGRRRADTVQGNLLPRMLSVPGEVRLDEVGVAISAEPAHGPMVKRASNAGNFAVVAARTIDTPLAVRSRRPGDRLRPAGLGGRKKLQDLFVDLKVPRGRRDEVPIVVDGRDRVVWVVGHAVSQDFAVRDEGEAVIILKAKRLGGAG